MEKEELEITYKTGKEKTEGIIKISLNRYQKSYAEHLFHLGDYSESVINDTIYPEKEEFLDEAIKKQFGDNASITKTEKKKLIKEIDQLVKDAIEED